MDQAGTAVYIADTSNAAIRKLNVSTGTWATVAAGYGTDNRTMSPESVEVDAAGNVYFGDNLDQRIRMIPFNGNGAWSVIGGNGTAGYADGNGNSSQFRGPMGMGFSDGVNKLYVADPGNGRVRIGTPPPPPPPTPPPPANTTVPATNATEAGNSTRSIVAEIVRAIIAEIKEQKAVAKQQRAAATVVAAAAVATSTAASVATSAAVSASVSAIISQASRTHCILNPSLL